jgi:hypothetical protein
MNSAQDTQYPENFTFYKQGTTIKKLQKFDVLLAPEKNFICNIYHEKLYNHWNKHTVDKILDSYIVCQTPYSISITA